jgi:hypothetical protein
MFELPTEKSIKKALGLKYSSREPIPADKKRKVREKAGNKCEVCRKKPYRVTLEFHHKNMKNDDNRPSNLQLLCPTHHKQKHAQARRKVYRDIMGRKYYTRLVKKKIGKKAKRRRKAKSLFEKLL